MVLFSGLDYSYDDIYNVMFFDWDEGDEIFNFFCLR